MIIYAPLWLYMPSSKMDLFFCLIARPLDLYLNNTRRYQH